MESWHAGVVLVAAHIVPLLLTTHWIIIITGVTGSQTETPLVNVALAVTTTSLMILSLATVDLGHVTGAVVVAPVRGGVGLAGGAGGGGGGGDADVPGCSSLDTVPVRQR